MKAIVTVTPRKGVLDPQGKAVAQALGRLGFDQVDDVRQGKVIEIALKSADRSTAEADVRAMCEKLLANTVIEDFSFELVD